MWHHAHALRRMRVCSRFLEASTCCRRRASQTPLTRQISQNCGSSPATLMCTAKASAPWAGEKPKSRQKGKGAGRAGGVQRGGESLCGGETALPLAGPRLPLWCGLHSKASPKGRRERDSFCFSLLLAPFSAFQGLRFQASAETSKVCLRLSGRERKGKPSLELRLSGFQRPKAQKQNRCVNQLPARSRTRRAGPGREPLRADSAESQQSASRECVSLFNFLRFPCFCVAASVSRRSPAGLLCLRGGEVRLRTTVPR